MANQLLQYLPETFNSIDNALFMSYKPVFLPYQYIKKGIKFPTLDIGERMIKTACSYAGFKLTSRSPKSIHKEKVYVRYTCNMQEKGNPQKTSKQGCDFTINFQIKDDCAVVGSVNLTHDHGLCREETLFYRMSNRSIQFLSNFHKSVSSEKDTLFKFSDKILRIKLNNDCYRKIIESDKRTYSLMDDYDKMAKDLSKSGGKCTPIYRNIDGKKVLYGAITVTQSEIYNLEHYGDLIFMDGTRCYHVGNWDCIPITLLDDGLSIISGGIIFVKDKTKETYDQILNYLITDYEIDKKLPIYVTDQDTTLHALLEAKFPGRNILCTWHKGNNLVKQNYDEEVTDAFHTITSTTDGIEYQEAEDLIRIRAIREGSKGYLLREIVPYINEISKYLNMERLTFGHSTTGPAESMNHLLKKSLSTASYLFEIRRNMTSRLDLNFRNRTIQRAKKCFTDFDFENGLFFFENTQKIMKGTIAKAKRLIVEETDDEKYIIKDPNHPEKMKTITNDECTYCKSKMFGLPCSHILAIRMRNAHDNKWFPFDLLHERYMNDRIVAFVKSQNILSINLNARPEMAISHNDAMIDSTNGDFSNTLSVFQKTARIYYNNLLYKFKNQSEIDLEKMIEVVFERSLESEECCNMIKDLLKDLMDKVNNEFKPDLNPSYVKKRMKKQCDSKNVITFGKR